ncbi:MAG: hypothetical protein PW792_10515 [Acidobacteriaceae bacterium]|nr:hypothetical protein [Acidobacteriaceae bacterium]
MRFVFLGPDGAGKSSVIAGLMASLSSAGIDAGMRHLKPRMVATLRGQQVTIVTDPHGKPPRGAFASMVKIGIWLGEEWYARWFTEKNDVLVCDRYYHDLLVDPVRYRFGAPIWLARLFGKFMPQPRLWILLNAPPEVLQARKQEVTPEETARQCAAYLHFVQTQRRHVIVDASQPLERVIADVTDAVTAAIALGPISNG